MSKCAICGKDSSILKYGMCLMCDYKHWEHPDCPRCGASMPNVMGNRQHGTCMECSALWESVAEYDAWIEESKKIPWCAEHQCPYILFDDLPGESQYYNCPECRKES
jgi:hypothetical protein